MVMKLGSVDFTKGINAITDRRLMPEGNVVFADNVDLRSGSMRAFNLPQCYATITVPAGTTCLFEFRNNWYFSAAHRSYVCEVTESQERIYFTEDGSGHIAPSKTVNGATAVLGAIVPTLPPSVNATTRETVSNITVSTSTSGGGLQSGSYGYRISTIINGKILPACQTITATIPHAADGSSFYEGSANLSWKPVAGASGYIIFGRIAQSEQTLVTLGPVNSWTDVGSIAGSGTYASNYDSNNPLHYVYTYVRSIGGMEDESGPSPISKAINSGTLRIVYNNPINDGLVDMSNLTTVSNSAIFQAYTQNFVGALAKGSRSIFNILAQVDQRIWWTSGMQVLVRLSASGDLSDPISFTIPGVLPTPTLIATTVASSTNTTLANGTHTYSLSAIRGTTTPFSGQPAQTPASTTLDATVSGASRGYLSTTVSGVYNTPGNQDGAGATTGAAGYVTYPNVCYMDPSGVLYFTETDVLQGDDDQFDTTNYNAIRTLTSGTLSTYKGGIDNQDFRSRFYVPPYDPTFSAGIFWVLNLSNGKKLAGGDGGLWYLDGTNATLLKNQQMMFKPGVQSYPIPIYPVCACQNSSGIYVAESTRILKIIIRLTDYTFNAQPLSGSSFESGHVDGSSGTARYQSIQGITSDSSGNLYVTDSRYIRKVDSSGTCTSIAGNGTRGLVDGTGTGAQLYGPTGITFNTDSKLYFTDQYCVRQCTTSGAVTLVAGNYTGVSGHTDGSGGGATFEGPTSITNDTTGKLWVGDIEIIRTITGTTVATIAGVAGGGWGRTGTGHQDGGAIAATYNQPKCIGIDSNGYAYIGSGYCIRKMSPDGSTVTLAGTDGVSTNYKTSNYNGTGSAARFAGPVGIAVDSTNNVYVLDGVYGAMQVRKITPDGVVTTFNTMLDTSMNLKLQDVLNVNGICIDYNNNVFVTAGTIVSQLFADGTASIISGTYGTAGRLDNTSVTKSSTWTNASAITSDEVGNLYIHDNGALRVIKATGGTRTLLGTVGYPGHTDGAMYGQFNVLNAGGLVYLLGGIYETEPHCIRYISLDRVSWTHSTIRTIASVTNYSQGGYNNALSPGGVTYDPARFYNPTGIVWSSNMGGVWICDTQNQVIRGVKYIASGKTVGITWNAVNDADGYVLYRTFNGTTYQVKTITGQASSYTDDGSYESTATVPTVNTTGGTWSRVFVISADDLPLTGATVDATATAYLCRTDFPNTGTPPLTNKSTIYVTSSTQTDLTGVQGVYLAISALPSTYDATKFFLPVYTSAPGSITYAGANSIISTLKSWRIYRSGDTGSEFSFVAEVPINKTSYTDNLGATDLGGTIPTSYVDAGNALVTFAPPPTDLHGLELYNGMLFGISGNTVRWTPTGVPDAWPVAYGLTFPFRPLKLKSFAGGLIALCEDGIYRIDGYDPSSIQQTKTRADGCIAGHSVQISDGRLLYLSKRGVMEFSGMDAVCITEMMIPYKLMLAPSTYQSGYSAPKFWWYPTAYQSTSWACLKAGKSTVNYQDDDLPGTSPAKIATVVDLDNPITGVIDAIRSFVWQNKYFLYYSMDSNYEANACWCVDLALPGNPVTTLGIRPLDVHVSADGECYMLLKDWSTTPSVDPVSAFLGAASQFDVAYSNSVPAQDHLSVYKFNPTIGQGAPIRFRTREFTAGAPNLRKRWREIRVHGDGTCQMRVFIDGALKQLANDAWWGTIDCTENPNQPRRLLLPTASWGYSLSVEIVGSVDVRMIEIGYDAMPGDM